MRQFHYQRFHHAPWLTILDFNVYLSFILFAVRIHGARRTCWQRQRFVGDTPNAIEWDHFTAAVFKGPMGDKDQDAPR